MKNQEKINHIIEDCGMKLETFLERLQDGDSTRREMERTLKGIIKLNKILSEFAKNS